MLKFDNTLTSEFPNLEIEFCKVLTINANLLY